jgi:hypothetical protein
MYRQTLRYSILVLGFIPAVIHAVFLNLQGLDWLMLLNGLGFLVLTGAIFFRTQFAGRTAQTDHLLVDCLYPGHTPGLLYLEPILWSFRRYCQDRRSSVNHSFVALQR